MNFHFFVIISPWRNVHVRSFIWIQLNPLHPKMLLSWPCGSGDFLNFVNGFSLSRNYLPMEKGVALYLPTTNGCFVQSFLVVLEKKMNKRPMHHIAHLKNKFISINTNGYIKTLIRRRQKKPRGPWATSLTWVNSSNQ